MSEAFEANSPLPIIDRLLESETAFNVIAPVFCIWFATGLALWAATGFLANAISPAFTPQGSKVIGLDEANRPSYKTKPQQSRRPGAQVPKYPRDRPTREQMLKGRKKELWDKAEDERRRCTLWLLKFMRDGQPKLATKAELREVAVQDLKVSKNSFDAAWIGAIENAGRQDWYEPLRRKPRRRQ